MANRSKEAIISLFCSIFCITSRTLCPVLGTQYLAKLFKMKHLILFQVPIECFSGKIETALSQRCTEGRLVVTNISCSKIKLWLDNEWKMNSHWICSNIGTRVHWGCEISIVGNTQNLRGKATEQLCQLSHILKVGVNMVAKDHFQEEIFYISMVLEYCS